MKIIRSVRQMQAWSRSQRLTGKRIGLVPTMGALHEGHMSVARASIKLCDVTAVSIYVNPTQFSASEDLKKYPRPFAHDSAMCNAAGVDVIFAPTTDEMYPGGYLPAGVVRQHKFGGTGVPACDSSAFSTYIDELTLSRTLEGASRPGHFRGVCTVVAKLFNCVLPDFAFFGQKDAQQLAVIRRMACDLNFPLRIIACPIVREPDGLAMSSRNVYLSSAERRDALVLKQALDWAVQEIEDRQHKAARLKAGMKRIITAAPSARVDYIAIADKDTFEPLTAVQESQTLIALAVFVGKTRLIDNAVV